MRNLLLIFGVALLAAGCSGPRGGTGENYHTGYGAGDNAGMSGGYSSPDMRPGMRPQDARNPTVSSPMIP